MVEVSCQVCVRIPVTGIGVLDAHIQHVDPGKPNTIMLLNGY